VDVTIDTPAGITNFTGTAIGDDFYFIGKAQSPTTTFNVKYKVVLKDPIKCVLIEPDPADDTKTTAGGLITPYKVQNKVNGEKKMSGNIYFLPVEIKVNNTAEDEDDFVAVSKGTDEDLATDFSVKLTGTDGVTAKLKVKPADGDIKFRDEELELESRTEKKTKLWGIAPSSDRDKTIIEVTLKKDYKELGKIEEDVTVFKGVRIELKGNYYVNVDTREFGKRPWDGRKDPKPNVKGDLTGFSYIVWFHNAGGIPITKFKDGDKVPHLNRKIKMPDGATDEEKAHYKKAVDQSATFGYESALSFTKGDNPGIPLYKPWAEAVGGKIEVKVINVYAKTPDIKIEKDELIESLVKMKKGHFKGHVDFKDQIVDPEIEVENFILLHQTTKDAELQPKAVGGGTYTVKGHLTPQITAARGTGYDELLDIMGYLGEDLVNFSSADFKWDNDTFELQRLGKFKMSLATKALAAEKENKGKIEAGWNFTKWNEFQFKGELKKAYIETK
jgi:hypothetical protein